MGLFPFSFLGFGYGLIDSRARFGSIDRQSPHLACLASAPSLLAPAPRRAAESSSSPDLASPQTIASRSKFSKTPIPRSRALGGNPIFSAPRRLAPSPTLPPRKSPKSPNPLLEAPNPPRLNPDSAPAEAEPYPRRTPNPPARSQILGFPMP
ncbi:hypothetical protein PVAP13_5NG103608 [Panicum virgatum]|uniref:Uncharacterized protein n=1 Tax=Panicum virgatum TaxID=38727 RepID=A0A8T0RL41_PANVG|nr:hypothetical protein PVAP13_5NG103608 [Panicum virgatum]